MRDVWTLNYYILYFLIPGLLPSLKGQFIYKAELVDMALQLFMQDLLPIAEALGIHFTKLITYRPAFDPSHFETGTTDFLSKFLIKFKADMSKGLEKGTTRPLFCTEIGKFYYQNVAALGVCGKIKTYSIIWIVRLYQLIKMCIKENTMMKCIDKHHGNESQGWLV